MVIRYPFRVFIDLQLSKFLNQTSLEGLRFLKKKVSLPILYFTLKQLFLFHLLSLILLLFIPVFFAKFYRPSFSHFVFNLVQLILFSRSFFALRVIESLLVLQLLDYSLMQFPNSQPGQLGFASIVLYIDSFYRTFLVRFHLFVQEDL